MCGSSRSRRAFTHRLAAWALALQFGAQAGWASEACIPVRGELAQGGEVTHPSFENNGTLPGPTQWAGTFNALIDGNGPFELYCVDLSTKLCRNECYGQAPDLVSDEIVWILNNYYPAVPGEPSDLQDDSERARAVQLAIWHFSDGIDIVTGGMPTQIFNAARGIIAAASVRTVPRTPMELSLVASSSSSSPGKPYTVTATLLDQGREPMPGATISFEVAGVNPAHGEIATNADGDASFSYSGTNIGTDEIRGEVLYTIPVGLRWVRDGCQTLITGEAAPGAMHGSVKHNWNLSASVEESRWGRIKALYK